LRPGDAPRGHLVLGMPHLRLSFVGSSPDPARLEAGQPNAWRRRNRYLVGPMVGTYPRSGGELSRRPR